MNAVAIGSLTIIKPQGDGAVFHGDFTGKALISIFDSKSKRGLLARFVPADIATLKPKLEKEFGLVDALQIKVICLKREEAQIKEAFAKANLKLFASAPMEDSGPLEVYFYSESGRLRVAEASKQTPAPKAQPRVEAVKPAIPLVKKKVRVLIVDDSKTMRTLLRKILSESPDIEVVAEAELPSQVKPLLQSHKPDVMTLDINMPEMTGVELLRILLKESFIPTVMISSLNIDEGKEVLTALELGAVDYIQKPANHEISAVAPLIQEKIIAAASVRDRRTRKKSTRSPRSSSAKTLSQTELLAVGASTGGTEAIKSVFIDLPADVPPIVVVQHIPPYFSTAFANRLNELCKFEVKEAEDGDEVRAGRALIAPGGYHMEIKKEGGKLVARLNQQPAVNRFRPSVDVLFNSVATLMGAKATGVLLTGMGSDGAKGLLAMKNAGAYTIAQNEESSVVYGMPRAAAEIGAAVAIEALEDMASILTGAKAA